MNTPEKKTAPPVRKAVVRRRLLSRAAGFLAIASDVLDGAAVPEDGPLSPVNFARLYVRDALRNLQQARARKKKSVGADSPR